MNCKTSPKNMKYLFNHVETIPIFLNSLIKKMFLHLFLLKKAVNLHPNLSVWQ